MVAAKFAAVLLLAGLSGCSAAGRQESQYFGKVEAPAENVFRYNNGAEPEYLDPGLLVADTDERIASMLFEALTIKDPKTLQPEPGVAERWDASDDGLSYTFYLRKNAQWSDGRPVTAHDFVYSWTRVLNPKTAARYASQLYPIKNAQAFNEGKIKDASEVGLRAIDDYTLQVTLDQPIPYFLFLTSFFTMYPVPSWIVEKHGEKWTDPANIVGNGPFRLVEHRTHDRIVLERNPKYWNASTVRLDRVIAYPIDDNYTAANLYEAGELDYLVSNSVPVEYIPYMKERFQDFHSSAFLATYFYIFNVTRPPMNNPLVRRALSMAVDRTAITDDLLRGGQIPGVHFVPLGMLGYESPPGPEYDLAKARQLLAEAGFPNGKGFPNLELSYNTLELHKKVSEAIQQMWAKNLNIHVLLRNEEWAAFIKTRHNLEHDIARDGWIADYPDPAAFLEILESNNGNNETGWKNAEYDRLMNLSRRERDPLQRLGLLKEAETIVMREVPVIPIYTYGVNYLKKPYVQGIYPTALDIHPLNEVTIDRQWRERVAETRVHWPMMLKTRGVTATSVNYQQAEHPAKSEGRRE